MRVDISGGIKASLTNEVLLEESVFGWKEYEMEVMRDKKDNAVIVCAIENMDPMGIHTGDSITVAPTQTLTDREYQVMRDASLKVLRVIGVETVEQVQEGIMRYQIGSEKDCDIRRELASVVIGNGWGLLELRAVEMSLEDVFVQLVTQEEHVQ